MTLAELQVLAMRQAVAKLERLQARRDRLQAKHTDKPEPDGKESSLEWLQEEIDEQALQIAKLAYLQEREQGYLDRAEAMHALRRSELLARIAELEHLTKHRDGVLAAFRESNEIHKAGNEIQREGLAAIAEAVRGRA